VSFLGLFQREVTVAVLASGSSGNCTYIGDGHAGVLVDCGLSTRQILRRMDELGLADAPVDGVLVTHEHSDHIGGARVLAKRLRKLRGRSVPFFMTRGTLAGAPPQCVPDGVEPIIAGQSFRVRHFEVDPFTVPHDVEDPVAYRVRVGDTHAAVITDLGRPTALVARKMRQCDVLVLEYNHDSSMLMDGSYPWHLKQRIRSNHGHLSNEQSDQLLKAGLGQRLRHLVLAHLSEENNCRDRAADHARRVLSTLGADHVSLQVARQDAPLPPLRVSASRW